MGEADGLAVGIADGSAVGDAVGKAEGSAPYLCVISYASSHTTLSLDHLYILTPPGLSQTLLGLEGLQERLSVRAHGHFARPLATPLRLVASASAVTITRSSTRSSTHAASRSCENV